MGSGGLSQAGKNLAHKQKRQNAKATPAQGVATALARHMDKVQAFAKANGGKHPPTSHGGPCTVCPKEA